jgi:hypothetical protein
MVCSVGRIGDVPNMVVIEVRNSDNCCASRC